MLVRALLRLPIRSRPLLHTEAQCHYIAAGRISVATQLRNYATPGRPKGVVGQPSRPVKRAVKREARKPADGESAAEKRLARGAGAKKPKAKPKKKQPLTPEQKAKKKEKAKVAADKVKLVELRKIALDPPKKPQVSGYQVFVTEKLKGGKYVSGSGEGIRISDAMRSVSREWKSLAAADIEHYNHLAVEKRVAGNAEYKRWIESHTPEQILQANAARSQLRRRESSARKAKKWSRIEDERAVKRPLSSFAQFSISRHASGDFKNIALTERGKLIGQEWKELSEQEKQKYRNLHQQEYNRYLSEYADTYGHEPPQSLGNDKPEAVSAAA